MRLKIVFDRKINVIKQYRKDKKLMTFYLQIFQVQILKLEAPHYCCFCTLAIKLTDVMVEKIMKECSNLTTFFHFSLAVQELTIFSIAIIQFFPSFFRGEHLSTSLINILPRLHAENRSFNFCSGLLFSFSKFQQIKKMGCEPSGPPQHQTCLIRVESIQTDEDVELGAQCIINRHRGDPHEIYHFSKVVSRGRSIVRKVLDRKSRIERICKILNSKKNGNLFTSYQEVEILKKLNHPNIVQIVEYFNQPNYLYIIQESIPGLSLHQLFCRQEICSLEVIFQIVKQILIALKFCHQKGFAHRAINPEHIIIVKLEKCKSILVKLVGFGRSAKNGLSGQEKSIVRQDPIFNSPESGNETLADKQDIWACGIIFLELISGQRKFQNFLERVNIIIREVFKKQMMPEDQKLIMIDFLTKMLQLTPQKRLSAEEALDHQIFRINHKKTIYVKQDNSQVLHKILQFKVENNLKSLFYIYATLNILSVEEKTLYLSEFYNLDKNKDGKIDFDELVQCMQNTFEVEHETAVERVSKIFKQTNKERGHYLQFHEYVAATTLASKQFYEHKLRRLFDELDTNKNGIITKEELSRAVEGVKSSYLLKDYQQLQITYNDFKNLLRTMFQEESQTRSSPL